MKEDEYRFKKPMDYLHQRKWSINGALMHDIYNLPGRFIKILPPKTLDGDGSMSESDITYLVELENKEKLLINVEDETSAVNKDTLIKLDRYKTNFKYFYNLPVYSIITTTLPSKRCLKELDISPTDSMKVDLISYLDLDGEKLLNNLRMKVKNKQYLSKKELLQSLDIVKSFSHNNAEILEEYCKLIKEAKCRDYKFKMEIRYCCRYLIHKYAETLDDIIRLEEVIGLEKIITCGEIIDNIRNEGKEKWIKEGKREGRIEGRIEGELSILNEISKTPNIGLSIEELSNKFGYSIKEIVNAK